MRCADLEELISAYADGQTVPAQAEFVEAHVATCGRCQLVLRRHQETRRLLSQLGGDDWVPPDLRFRVVQAYRRRQPALKRPWLLAGSTGTVAALLLVLGLIRGMAVGPYASSGALVGLIATPTPVVAHRCQTCTYQAALRRRRLPMWLTSSLLAESFDVAAADSMVLDPPLPAGWPSAPIESSRIDVKGGGASRNYMPSGHRLQAS
jgi:anti-sigma factor RsiW